MENEKQWIKRIKRKGCKLASNQLISKYYKEMYGFIYKQTIDRELSLDLTQELFISVLKTIDNFDEKKASFRTWLYKIAANKLVDYYRSRGYRQGQHMQSIQDYDCEDGHDITLSLEYKEDFEKVTALINEMDASSQQILRLKLFGEYTFQEIAEIEMLSQSTVKTKYYTALKWVRERMKEEYYTYE